MMEKVQNLITSAVVFLIIFYSFQVTTICIFVFFVLLGILGLKYRFSAQLFIFGNIAFAIHSVLYCPILSSISLMFPNVQPKPITTLIMCFTLSAIGGLFTAKQHTSRLNFFHFLLPAAVGIIFFTNISKFPYDSYTLITYIFVISASTVFIFSHFRFDLINQNYFKYAFAIFIMLTILNITPLNKDTKILGIIENHSVWGKSEFRYDQSNWTLQANYSYSMLNEVLSRKYKTVSINNSQSLIKNINSCDTILIFMPTVPFTREEKELIHQYVQKGGKLLIIADHTDLYGHARVINDLIRNWGIKVNYDAIISPLTWYGKTRFRNSNIGDVRPLTACSLSSIRPSYVFAWSRDWISESANYNSPNFFGNLTWTGEDRVGDFPLALTSSIGRGFVTLWTDSTMYSNFALFQPKVLMSLKYLIERKGNYLSIFALYYSFLFLILLLIYILVPKIRKEIVIFMFLISALSGGTYLVNFISAEDFYPPGKMLKVYCKEELIREPISNQDPPDYSISNLYSNLPRFELYPMWKGEYPEEVDENAIWFTSYAEFKNRNNKLPKYVTIVDEMEEFNSFGSKNKKVITEGNIFKIEITGPRSVWQKDNDHTYEYKNCKLFSSVGVVNDLIIGDWWATIDVSPYRQEMIKRFTEWIKAGSSIQVYEYPEVGIRKGKHSLIMNRKGETKTLHNVSVKPFLYNEKEYVYLGGEMWGVLKKESDSLYIFSGSETSDNYFNYERNRYLFSLK